MTRLEDVTQLTTGASTPCNITTLVHTLPHHTDLQHDVLLPQLAEAVVQLLDLHHGCAHLLSVGLQAQD